uniref:Uncharacterized protein n=1 Tax=Oryza barthii TaxID=65489 RepID=A0A0D3HFH9_9ORYZ
MRAEPSRVSTSKPMEGHSRHFQVHGSYKSAPASPPPPLFLPPLPAIAPLGSLRGWCSAGPRGVARVRERGRGPPPSASPARCFIRFFLSPSSLVSSSARREPYCCINKYSGTAWVISKSSKTKF